MNRDGVATDVVTPKVLHFSKPRVDREAIYPGKPDRYDHLNRLSIVTIVLVLQRGPSVPLISSVCPASGTDHLRGWVT